MKKVLMALMAVAIGFVFVSVAAAQKSVVSIVKCTNKSDLKLLAEDFHINDDVSHEQTTAFHDKTGEYPRAVWSEASEKVWYKYVKDAVDKIGGLPIESGARRS